jgi:hypothetical protein
MTTTDAFKSLFKNVKETYLGKPVPKKYQKRYGKKYDKDEIESISIAIAKTRGIKIDK